MSATAAADPFVAFSPALRAGDRLANHWLRQVTLRLRREVRWRWKERQAGQVGAPGQAASKRLAESLDLTRYWEAKRRFFAEDTTARYLSETLAEPFRPTPGTSPRGSFGWLVEELELDGVSAFALGLGLITTFDSAAAPVIATCLNDPGRTQPTLELAQRLWDRPEEVLSLADPFHPLWRLGILQQPVPGFGGSAGGWDAPVVVPPLVAARLLFPGEPPAAVFPPLDADPSTSADAAEVELTVGRLEAARGAGLRVVPVRGRRGAAYREAVGILASAAGVEVRRLEVEPGQLEDAGNVRSLMAVAWLLGVALFLPEEAWRAGGDQGRLFAALSAARSIPATVFVAVGDDSELRGIPPELLVPSLSVPSLSYERRAASWRRWLAHAGPDLEDAISECARRFRYEQETIRSICDGLNRLGRAPEPLELMTACRAEIPIETGELAQVVAPRFEEDELVLPADRRLQLEEIYRAMASLTEVHYEWGTARVWNEGGISVLFAGPSGTGKTMAAEVLARRLDMPMVRIDLSQVVDKYIGVTEKNLKRLFDAADVSDLVLFFDEADALFGRRTEVRDAHDRYANLEISYLLERMERFKGLAILATNRRKDLDEAFLRRLRYIVEFPIPEVAEREEIWRRVIPPKVDASSLDVPFLARQFPLAGGHIRSIVFNACLQSAGGEAARPALTMEKVVVAVKREYHKLKRSVSLEQFGPYAPLVESICP
jgi:hypothetical protein